MNQNLPTNSSLVTQNLHLLNVSNKSKQIPTKVKNKSLPSKEACDSQKKYQTTNKKAKFELLDDIRRMIDPDLTDKNWCNTVLQYKPEEYKIFLKKLYPDLEIGKIPARWKKVKRTLINMEKSDGRGGALFGNEKEKKELKEHIEYVIRNKMKTKCFEELRRNVVPKIQEMLERNGRKFSEKMFQKHFWSYFLNDPENEALKKAWKKLRRTKPQKGAGNESFVSENMEILLDNADESFILDKDLEFLEEEAEMGLKEEMKTGENDIEIEVGFKEEMNKDSGNIDEGEICKLEERQGDDQDVEKEHDLSGLESVGGFFEKDCLIQDGKALQEEMIFDVLFGDFDHEIREYFEKKKSWEN